jgi:hypothetical protein
MRNSVILIVLLLITILLLFLDYLYNNQVLLDYKAIAIIIISLLVSVIFGYKITLLEKNIIKKYVDTFGLFGLIISFTGCVVWFIGELLIVLGYNDMPWVDATGALSCSIGALIALILYLTNKK